MYCLKCGHPFKDDEVVCSSCGNITVAAPVVTIIQPPVPVVKKQSLIDKLDDEEMLNETFAIFDVKVLALLIVSLLLFIAVMPLSVIDGGRIFVTDTVLISILIVFIALFVAAYSLKKRSLIIFSLFALLLFELTGIVCCAINMYYDGGTKLVTDIFALLGFVGGVATATVILMEMLGLKRFPELAIILAAVPVACFILQFFAFLFEMDTEYINFWLEFGKLGVRLMLVSALLVRSINQLSVNRDYCY